MLKSLLLVTVLRLERNCTHHICTNLRERRLNDSRIVENTNCINAIVFNYVYYIVFVHLKCILFAFIIHFLKLVVDMLWYVPYITSGFTDFCKPIII